MGSANNTKIKSQRFPFWAPRILAIVYVLISIYISRAALAENVGFWNKAFGLSFINIPALVVCIALFLSQKPLYWIPRVLSILYVLCLMVFSLDVFSENLGFWGTIQGLFIHNIPALILLIASVISWKYELVGAVVFNLAGLFYIYWLIKVHFPQQTLLSCILGIDLPAFIIGISFYINWRWKKTRGNG